MWQFHVSDVTIHHDRCVWPQKKNIIWYVLQLHLPYATPRYVRCVGLFQNLLQLHIHYTMPQHLKCFWLSKNVVQLHLPFATPQRLTVQKCATTPLTLRYYSVREVRLTVPKDITCFVQESTLPQPIKKNILVQPNILHVAFLTVRGITLR